MSKALGERILQCLQSQHMTQMELSSIIGIDRSTVNRFISGQREPGADQLARIAEALHVSTDYLLFGTDGSTATDEGEGTPSEICPLDTNDAALAHAADVISQKAGRMTKEQKLSIIERLL